MPYALPSTCEGCPFAGKSKYFTPDSLNESAEVMILAQNPGENEEQGLRLDGYYGYKEQIITNITPQPLIGPTGRMIEKEFWPLSNLDPFNTVSKANIIKCRPSGRNELPPLESRETKEAIRHCVSNHLRIPSSVKYILSLGQVALYGLTGARNFLSKSEDGDTGEKNKNSFFAWRGYVLGLDRENSANLIGLNSYYSPSKTDRLIKILPTLHPASLFKNEKMYRAVKCDFVKFGRLVRGEWPSPLPEVRTSFRGIQSLPNVLGFDTEYDIHDNNRLTLYSVATTKGEVYAVEPTEHLPLYRDTKIIGQNLLVDLGHLYSLVSSLPHFHFDDLMIAHSVLYPSEPHSLNYILSIDGRYNRHKHLAGEDFILYAGLDADTTLNDGWRACLKEFKRDPLSWKVYITYRRPLIEILYESEKKGIKLDQTRLSLVSRLLNEERDMLANEARLLVNRDDFNLGSSDQVSRVIYGLEEPEKRVKKPKKPREISSLSPEPKVRKRKQSLKSKLLQAEMDLLKFLEES